MTKKFFITLNENELNALMGIDTKAVAAYLYIKRNSEFSEGKTKKICFGALAVYLGGMDRTQAKRLVQKLEKLGLISSTVTQQIYNLVFCSVTQNDTITLDTLNTSDKKETSSYIKQKKDEEVFSGGLNKDKSATRKTVAPSFEAATPPNFEREGEGVTLSKEGALIQAHAIKKGWEWADNPKSLPFYEKAVKAATKTGQGVEELLSEFEQQKIWTEENITPVKFKIWIDDLNKTKSNPSRRKAPPRGEMIL